MRHLKNVVISCALCAAFLLVVLPAAEGLVLDIPKAKGVASDPIKYSFNLGAGERISFFFESKNATVLADFVEIAAGNHSIVDETLVVSRMGEYANTHDFPWILNITIQAVSYSAIAIDFYAKYSYMRTSGFYLSVAVAIVAAVTLIACVTMVISKRKVEAKA